MDIGEVHDSIFGKARIKHDVEETGMIAVQNRWKAGNFARIQSELDEL